jgi:heterodisulfide reductase subunit A
MSTENGRERIGVYVCHCGTNIAGVVDVKEVTLWAKEQLGHRGVPE